VNATTGAKVRKGKRGDGEGSIRWSEKKKLWIARLMVGYRPDGKPDIREVSAKLRGECQRKLGELRRRATTGQLGDAKAGRETVGAFLQTWLRSINGTMDADSCRRHRDNVNRHITPLIGRRKLSDLKPEHLVDMFEALRQKPSIRGSGKKGPAPSVAASKAGRPVKTLSPRTMKYCFTTIRRALDTAVSWGAVPRNVARAIDAPKVPRVEIVALKPDEVGKLLDHVESSEDRLAPLYALAVHGGCRLGELLALTWPDVDLEAGTLSVRRTLKGVKGGVPDLDDPKTPRSRRTIKLSPDEVAVLRTQRDRQAFERQALGDAYADYGLVFATPLGTAIDPTNALKRLQAAMRAAGLPVYTFHSLRHSAATMMLAVGVNPKVAADRLGHHSAAFTLDRYIHAVEGLDLDAAERVQAVIRKARQKTI
jgi:integrase